MLGIVFTRGAEVLEVRIINSNILIRNSLSGMQFGAIENLYFNHEGVIKEFPDLKDRKDWREEAIKRFKEKIKSFKTEDEQGDYIIKEVKKHGYLPMYLQKQGFRVQRFTK